MGFYKGALAYSLEGLPLQKFSLFFFLIKNFSKKLHFEPSNIHNYYLGG
uniref:Uncharacterized protein n=1 Tax=Rhizophora mucronata TaxID=61149 RepID=A0A2P2IXC8_RHIMU